MDRQGVWQGLLPAGTANQDPLFLISYDYVESGVTQRCGFICRAEDAEHAAESFWNQHPGEWFHLISVNDGSIERFWLPREGRFVTVPEKDVEL